ncbi:hypothetical protein BDV33DRAFT_202710 [Aspergillus novoparasiticus]|uniref:Uncharacterized protein n=1 Tax=Aspergillus novoparasiticus TaxID=986946 RepID=A0A5N6EXI6_9EURO|nr:hypothetical protein BDV33DRAFT_202710 [Aspergillus novoparasiticus]
MVYKKYEAKDKVILCKESDNLYETSLYCQGYEWVQIRWLKYNQSTAEVPFAIGRDIATSNDGMHTPFLFKDVRVATKEAGEKVFSSDELQTPPAKKTMKVTVEPFGGDVRVYQKVYKLCQLLFVNGLGPFEFNLIIKSDELAVGGAKPLTGTGYINVV